MLLSRRRLVNGIDFYTPALGATLRMLRGRQTA
jgi:hypothetical protein